jgi:hypothetical protein
MRSLCPNFFGGQVLLFGALRGRGFDGNPVSPLLDVEKDRDRMLASLMGKGAEQDAAISPVFREIFTA